MTYRKLHAIRYKLVCALFPANQSNVSNWLGHSDPEKLKEKANDVQRLSANELKKRQLEIKVRI